MIIGFSGHRKLNHSHNAISKKLKEILWELNPEKTISGMALGFDLLAANVCRILTIPYIAAIPFQGQESRWQEKDQLIYRKLLTLAQDRTILASGSEPYSPFLYQKRNEWTVDNSDRLVVYWDGFEKGGTFNCIRYTQSQQKPFINIYKELENDRF